MIVVTQAPTGAGAKPSHRAASVYGEGKPEARVKKTVTFLSPAQVQQVRPTANLTLTQSANPLHRPRAVNPSQRAVAAVGTALGWCALHGPCAAHCLGTLHQGCRPLHLRERDHDRVQAQQSLKRPSPRSEPGDENDSDAAALASVTGSLAEDAAIAAASAAGGFR